MADVRELLARLNPQTIKFDIGMGGGAPALTNQDIAAALAMVPPGLGREVMEACWWPDGALLRRRALRDAVLAAVMPELMRQAERLAEAHLNLQLAEAAVTWSRGQKTVEQSREIESCRGRLVSIRATTWPKNTVEHLPLLVSAIIAELAGDARCPSCEGRTTVVVGELVKSCANCGGSGIEPRPDRRRALAIQCDPSDYLKRWKQVYEWLFTTMASKSSQAAASLARALGRDEAA